MTNADRLYRWNAWYDGLPEEWRFQTVLWPLLLIGTINMALTIASGFPFGLLVLLAIVVLLAVRLPYNLGWLHAPGGGAEVSHGRTVSLGRIDWAYDLNRRYDAMPEWRRFWIVPGILVIAGAINMALTLGTGFSFGLLFLLALLVIIALRAPYVWGWLTPPDGTPRPVSRQLLTHDTAANSVAFPWVGPPTPVKAEVATSAVPPAQYTPLAAHSETPRVIMPDAPPMPPQDHPHPPPAELPPLHP